MKIFKSPTTDTVIADYNYLNRNHRSVATLVAFKLSTGKIADNTQQEIGNIYKLYPETVIDHAMPKPLAEWSITGRVYRGTGGSDYSLISLQLGATGKNVMADFSKTKDSYYPLNDPAFNRYFFQYDQGHIDLSRPLPNSFCELSEMDPARLRYAGTYDESTWLRLPNDFDYRFDNTAPLDQRQPGQWKAGDHYSLSGVGPDGRTFSADLPSIHTVAVMHRFKPERRESEFITGNAVFDTVKFYPEADLGIMIFHSLFEVEKGKDFDSLLILDLDQMTGNTDPATVPEPDFNECMKIVLDLHKDSTPSDAPVYEIQRQSKIIQKESRKIKHQRYCNVFMDYYRYTVICEEIPVPLKLAKDRIGYLLQDPSTFTPENRKQFTAINQALQTQIDSEDLNFNSQIGALVEECQSNSENPEFRKWFEDNELMKFTERMYLISYNSKPKVCSFRDFGLEQDGRFTIPEGIVIPSYLGETFINAAVFSPDQPHKPQFVIPGGQSAGSFCWFSALRDEFNIMFICDSITDALRMNEETYHYLGILYIQDPDQVLPDALEDCLDKADYILIPAPEGKEQEIFDLWKPRLHKVIVIPLGRNGDAQQTPFNSLRERLYSDESLEQWLQPYMPFQIIEPDYLSDDDYSAAINHAMAKKMKITPGQFDFDLGQIRELEAKRQESLKYCPDEKARKELDAAFDQAKNNLERYRNMSEQELEKLYVEVQEDQIAHLEKSLQSPGVPYNKFTPFVKPDEIVKFLRSQLEETKARNLHFRQVEEECKKEILEVYKERQEQQQQELEFALQENNLKSEDLVLLKQNEIYDNEKLYISDRDFSGLDLSRMKLKDSTFDRVKFCYADLSMVDFSGSTFNECDFSGAILRNSTWDNCTVVQSDFSKSVMEKGHLHNVQFLGGSVSDLSLREADLMQVKFSTTPINKLEIVDSKMILTDFEYTSISDLRIAGTFLKSTGFTRAELANTEFTECTMEKTRFFYTTGSGITMTGSTATEFSADTCTLEKLIFISSHLTNCNFTEVNAAGTTGSKNIFDELYIEKSDFSGSDFSYAVMKNSFITESNMRSINFKHANLFMSNLTKNAFGCTNFEEANLFSCDVGNSRFAENRFRDANLKRTAIEYQSLNLS